MSLAEVGALAAALAMSCAAFAPFSPRVSAIGPRFTHPDRRALNDAAWRRPLWQWESVRAVCVAAGAIVATATPIPLVVAVAATAVTPSLAIRRRASAARREARLATTRLLRAAEAAVRSGASLPEALRRAIATTDDRLATRPFSDALRAFDLGAPLDHALRASTRDADDRRTRMALETIAMGIASRLSYERAGFLIAAVADRLAFEERLDEEIRARTAGLRSEVVLLALLVPAIASYLALTVPSLAETLGQPIGRYVLVPAAVILETLGLIASRRAVEGVGG